MIGKILRYMSEKLTSIEDDVLSTSFGFVRSTPANTITMIPHAFDKVTGVWITPVSTTPGAAEFNGIPLFTTVVGYSVAVDADGNFVQYTVTDLPAYSASSIQYKKGAIVYNGTTAYKVLSAFTSATSFASDLALGYLEALPYTKFLKIIHTAADTNVSTFINYKVEGYQNSAA